MAAVEKGDAKEVAERIRHPPPRFKVNKGQDRDWRALLHHACRESSRSAVVPVFLAHPDINVNVKDKNGWTPFNFACLYGATSCVRELLKDSRVKVNEPATNGYAPLLNAARDGHLDVIRWWLASGRDIDLGKPGDIFFTDAIAAAKNYGRKEVVSLLERFKSDATQTRRAMRLELGWYDEAAAEVFALVVFVSDGLLQINDTTSTPAARFFSIGRRLPLELQMMLCFRQVGSDKEIIPGKESEVAFKELTRRLLWSSVFTN